MGLCQFYLLLRNVVDPLDGSTDVTHAPTCGPLLRLSPARSLWGTPKRQGWCCQCAHLWATSDFAPPPPPAFGTPLDGRGEVANLPKCGPLLIMSCALKCWPHPDGRGDVAHPHTFGPIFILPPPPPLPRYEALGTLYMARVTYGRGGVPTSAHLWAISDFGQHFVALGIPLAARVA